jgi:hypothetical protein
LWHKSASAGSTGTCTAAALAYTFRAASWNVYYKALDDSFGAAAITTAIDKANDLASFDFVGIVEAGGDTPSGKLDVWSKQSKTLKVGNGMAAVTGTSGYETIALFYRSESWITGAYHHCGEFESGRPYLLTQFARAGEDPALSRSLWVMVVHLNHYFITYPAKLDKVIPGDVMAEALQTASGTWNDMHSCVELLTIFVRI